MATTNTQPTTRNGGPAVGDPQAASENDMSEPPRAVRRQPTAQPPIKAIRTRIRLVATPARMTRRPAEPARVARQAIAAAAPIRVQPMAVDRVRRRHPVVVRTAAGRMGPAPTTELE